MRNLVKYLLPVFCFAVFFCNADDIHMEKQMVQICGVLEATAADVPAFSESGHDLCMPHPVTFEAPQNLRTPQRRTDAGQRFSCAFVKVGKRVCADFYIQCQNNSKQIFSKLPEQAMRLSRLGKLII